MKHNDVTKAVTARFPAQEYYRLQQEAENRGSTIADVIRDCWQQRLHQQHIEQHLMRLEQRLYKAQFEMLCEIINLPSGEREQARQALRRRGVQW